MLLQNYPRNLYPRIAAESKLIHLFPCWSPLTIQFPLATHSISHIVNCSYMSIYLALLGKFQLLIHVMSI